MNAVISQSTEGYRIRIDGERDAHWYANGVIMAESFAIQMIQSKGREEVIDRVKKKINAMLHGTSMTWPEIQLVLTEITSDLNAF